MVSCDSGHGVRNAIYLINSKILLTKPHSGIAVLMLSYLLPIRWQGHAVVSDHTVSIIYHQQHQIIHVIIISTSW